MTADALETTLTSFQLTDSFLPVGSYTASYGIESFVQEGIVEDADDVRELLTDYLHQQVGPCGMVAVRAAHEATTAGDLERLIAVDDRLHAATLVREFRESSIASGTQLLEIGLGGPFVSDYHERVTDGDAQGHFAVVLGALARQTDIPVRKACLMYGYSFVSGMLGASQRLLRLSHMDVQDVLNDLKPVIGVAWRESQGRDIECIISFAPSIELMSMMHERSERRLFTS